MLMVILKDLRKLFWIMSRIIPINIFRQLPHTFFKVLLMRSTEEFLVNIKSLHIQDAGVTFFE